MRLTEARIINPKKTIQFRSAAWLTTQTPKRAASILSEISRINIGRAATLAVDANNHAVPDFSRRMMDSLSTKTRKQVSEAIERMPTLDAGRFKTDILGMSESEAFGLTHAAWTLMDKKTSSDDTYTAHVYGLSATKTRQVVSSAKELSEMFEFPVLGTGQKELDVFYSWAAKTFLPENYGYQNIWESIRMNSSNAIMPKTRHLDGKKGQFHQCFHTAAAARSFFSQQGIPTEVFCFTVPGYGNHNVAVAYIEHQNKFFPTIVDASPFRGGYAPTASPDWTPFGWKSILSANDFQYPLKRMQSLWSKSPGGLPWTCVSLENGMHAILSAEIVTKLKHPERALERGTAEYYGHGETVRRIGFSVGLIIPDSNKCFEIELPISSKKGKLPIDINNIPQYHLESFCREVGPKSILRLIIEAAQSPAMDFLRMTRRFGLI